MGNHKRCFDENFSRETRSLGEPEASHFFDVRPLERFCRSEFTRTLLKNWLRDQYASFAGGKYLHPCLSTGQLLQHNR